MKLIKTIAIAIFFVIAITFALQNQQLISIHYYDLIPPFSVPLFLIVFFSILIGILIVGFADIFVRYSLGMKARKCEKELKRLKGEMETMRRELGEYRESGKPGEPESSAPPRISPSEDA